MGITTRIARMFKADIHGVMDQLEDKELLLKQYLRDMEDALSQKEACLRRIDVARTLAQQESDNYLLEIEKLEQDLTVALKKEKEDIARLLIKKIIPLSKLRDGVQHHIDNLDREIAEIKDGLDQQRIQYGHLKHRSRQYFHKAERAACKESGTLFYSRKISDALSNEEIELELLQRKEALSSP